MVLLVVYSEEEQVLRLLKVILILCHPKLPVPQVVLESRKREAEKLKTKVEHEVMSCLFDSHW